MASTFVFLDLETTGLGDDCKITEMCLCAVSRAALVNGPITTHPRFPRVIDKLILCFDPARELSSFAESLTGLTRQLLVRNKRGVFSRDVADFLKSFLRMQAQPVCLVAHNGNRFDFGIIAQHFRDVGVELPAEMGLRCFDTMQAFKALKLKPATVNFKLGTLYKKYVGGEVENAHTAEGDCLCMLELVYNTAEEVIPWADRNAEVYDHCYLNGN